MSDPKNNEMLDRIRRIETRLCKLCQAQGVDMSVITGDSVQVEKRPNIPGHYKATISGIDVPISQIKSAVEEMHDDPEIPTVEVYHNKKRLAIMQLLL